MKFKNTFVTLLTGLLLLAAGIAQAQIVEVGDLNIIDDAGNPSDGLRYLDMTYSDGLTMAAALTNAQAVYANARLATAAEFDDLFSAAGIMYNGSLTASDGFTSGPDTTISGGINYDSGALSSLLGYTHLNQTRLWTEPDGTHALGSSRDYVTLRPTHTAVLQSFQIPGENIRFGWLIVSEPIVNEPPSADAGSDQSIRAGDTVNLDGSGSFDDNTASASLIYSWSFSTLPGGSSAVLSGANTATPSFVADVEDTYVVQLVVIDEGGLSSVADEVTISSDNMAPTAVAEVDFSLAIIGNAVNFDGSGSTDPEMDALTYSWSITAAPAGSTAMLAGDTTATPSLTTDVEGIYTVSLTVSDFLGPGAPTSIDVTATTASGFAEIVIVDSSDQAAALTAGQVTTGGNQNAFGNFLAQAISLIQEGDIAGAIDKLNKAIARTDGCFLRGSVDGNGPGRDWITDCAAQLAIYDLLTQAVDALEN